MSKQSLKLNAILNIIKSCSNIIFPLITFKYVSSILSADSLGKYSFSSSVISYFSLIASLGIQTYAIRECSRIRNNKEILNNMINEIFSINFISTIFSYGLLALSIICIPKLQDYKYLLFILSINIIFTTLGTDWVNQVFEDFRYITFRVIIFQIISFILLFLFVKKANDYLVYALITVLSSTGASILNFFYVKKYFKLKFIINKSLLTHLKSIILLFMMTLSITIYVNLDAVMVGFYMTNTDVGIYSVAVKIYTTVKTLIMAVVSVMLPRIALLIETKQQNLYECLLIKCFDFLIKIMIPLTVGLIIFAPEIIGLLSSKNYGEASISLQILSIAAIFSISASFFSNTIFIPYRQEKYMLFFTLLSAFLNFILNLVSIPNFGINGAALTTVIAEFTVCILTYKYSKRIIKLNIFYKLRKTLVVATLEVLAILIAYYFISNFINGIFLMITTVIFSIISYIIILYILKDNQFLDTINKVRRCFLFHKIDKL